MFDTCRAVFQFHKVRLKVLVCFIEVVSILFQFHKVRLKDNRIRNYSNSSRVSIP